MNINELRYGPGIRFSLRLECGECVGLTGPSGGGKTLLLRALADLDPSNGDLSLNQAKKETVEPAQWRKQVGYLSSESAWWATRVGEHFNLENNALLITMGFENQVLNWDVQRLSSGERQRLAFIRLLCQKPKVLLLDEPTANLDSENKAQLEKSVLDYLRTQKAACLWVSHDREQLKRVSKRSLHLSSGVWRESPT